MTIGPTLIFEAGPLAHPTAASTSNGCAPTSRRACTRFRGIASASNGCRSRGHPVWVDDDHFTIGYHVRHTALPRPGDERALKRLAARTMSQQLDRGKPLWEAWAVEGLEDGRFALIMKSHHCMTDGVAAVDLATVLFAHPRDHHRRGATLDAAPGAVGAGAVARRARAGGAHAALGRRADSSHARRDERAAAHLARRAAGMGGRARGLARRRRHAAQPAHRPAPAGRLAVLRDGPREGREEPPRRHGERRRPRDRVGRAPALLAAGASRSTASTSAPSYR